MKKNAFPLSALLSLLLLLFFLAGAAEAKTPWHWRMSLRTDAVVGAIQTPTALFVDAQKNRYYIADSGNNRLLSYDREGKLLHSFTADNALKTPYDMIKTETGLLWVVEKGRNSLTMIDTRGQKTIPHTLKNNGLLVFPDQVEYNNNRLYLLDKASGDILVLDQSLAVQQHFACPAESDAGGFVDFNVIGNEVWSLDQRSRTVYHFNEEGMITETIRLEEGVHSPVSLAISTTGIIYVLDRLDGAICAFDRSGRFKYRFLGSGQARGQLFYPKEIRFDPWGQLCIVDEGNGRVEIFGR